MSGFRVLRVFSDPQPYTRARHQHRSQSVRTVGVSRHMVVQCSAPAPSGRTGRTSCLPPRRGGGRTLKTTICGRGVKLHRQACRQHRPRIGKHVGTPRAALHSAQAMRRQRQCDRPSRICGHDVHADTLALPPTSYQPLTAASRRARAAFRCGRRELPLLPMSHAAQCCGLPLLPGHHRSAHQGEPAEASPRPRADDPQEPRCHHRLPPSISRDIYPTSAGASSRWSRPASARWPTAALSRRRRAFPAPRTSRVGASSNGPVAYLDKLPDRGADELAHLRGGRKRHLAALAYKAGGYLAWSDRSETRSPGP